MEIQHINIKLNCFLSVQDLVSPVDVERLANDIEVRPETTKKIVIC